MSVRVATFWWTTTVPGGAPISDPSRSAIRRSSGSQSLVHASTPRSAHAAVNSASESGTDAGIAPSELFTR